MAFVFGEPPSCVLRLNSAYWIMGDDLFDGQLSSLNQNTLYDDLICTQIAMEWMIVI